MTRRRSIELLLVAIIVASVVVVPWVFLGTSILDLNPTQRGGGGGGGSNLQMDPAFVYPNLNDLAGNSTIVVHGTIAGVAATYNFTSEGIVHTFHVYNVTVIGYVRGSGPSSILLDTGLGGTVPQPAVGQEYVLFLRLADFTPCPANYTGICAPQPPTPPDLTYGPTGGPQGRFFVENGLVFGMKTLYPEGNEWMMVDANAVPLQVFTLQIEQVTSA